MYLDQQQDIWFILWNILTDNSCAKIRFDEYTNEVDKTRQCIVTDLIVIEKGDKV